MGVLWLVQLRKAVPPSSSSRPKSRIPILTGLVEIWYVCAGTRSQLSKILSASRAPGWQEVSPDPSSSPSTHHVAESSVSQSSDVSQSEVDDDDSAAFSLWDKLLARERSPLDDPPPPPPPPPPRGEL